MQKLKAFLNSVPFNTALTIICAVLAVTNPQTAQTVCPVIHAAAQAAEA